MIGIVLTILTWLMSLLALAAAAVYTVKSRRDRFFIERVVATFEVDQKIAHWARTHALVVPDPSGTEPFNMRLDLVRLSTDDERWGGHAPLIMPLGVRIVPRDYPEVPEKTDKPA